MSDEGTRSIQNKVRRRRLAWPACYNTRDLGGLPTRDGRETRWQAVIRSDVLSRLTVAGRQALLDYGVRTVIDLRSEQEVTQEPSLSVAGRDGHVEYFNLPLDRFEPDVGALIREAETHGEVYRIILDHYPDAVVEILRAMASARPGGIVVHCHAGKDRTGMIVALLLALAGVQAEIIAADYAESQTCLWPLYEEIVAENPELDPEALWVKPLATEDSIYLMVHHLEAEYGGVERYLAAYGLSSEDMERLRERLLG